MSKQFTVNSYTGKADSLRQSIKIAFTLTPVRSKRGTVHYSPLALSPTSFGAYGENQAQLSWDSSSFTLNHGTVTNQSIQPGSLPPGMIGLPRVLPGQSITLTSPTKWTSPTSYNDPEAFEEALGVFVNGTESKKSLVIGLRGSSYHTVNVLVYRSIESSHFITVPSSFSLQAYIVSEAVTGGTILLPENLTRPIFPFPIHCNALPASTKWILYQDDSGVIRLRNEEYPALGSVQGSPTRTLRGPARDAATTQMSDILERLSAIENLVHDNHDQPQELKLNIPPESQTKDMATSTARLPSLDVPAAHAQDQLAAVEKSTAPSKPSPALESRVARLEKYLEKTKQEQRWAARILDRRIDAKADKLELGILQVSITDLDRRVSVLEARSDGDEGGLVDSSSDSVASSAVTFPSHLTDNPTSNSA